MHCSRDERAELAAARSSQTPATTTAKAAATAAARTRRRTMGSRQIRSIVSTAVAEIIDCTCARGELAAGAERSQGAQVWPDNGAAWAVDTMATCETGNGSCSNRAASSSSSGLALHLRSTCRCRYREIRLCLRLGELADIEIVVRLGGENDFAARRKLQNLSSRPKRLDREPRGGSCALGVAGFLAAFRIWNTIRGQKRCCNTFKRPA